MADETVVQDELMEAQSHIRLASQLIEGLLTEKPELQDALRLLKDAESKIGTAVD